MCEKWRRGVEMTDVFIIGKGPAGISAALYTARAGFSTVVTGYSKGSLGKAEKIENYYGFAEPISGEELFENGIRGAKRLGVTVLDEEVFSVSYDGNFKIQTDAGEHESEVLIIAAGSVRKSLPVKGLKEFEGAGVSYCAVCDAFFHRGNDVAVIGNGAYAVSEAEHLAGVVNKVFILTDGKEMEAKVPENIVIRGGKIAEISGEQTVSKVIFEDGSEICVSGVFVAMGNAGSTDLGRKLGVVDPQGNWMISENGSTPLPGLYAAGDCTGGLLQISKAVSDGAEAGTAAAKYLREKRKNRGKL